MAHTFLSLIVESIPKETKDYVPTFWSGLFSNDGIKDGNGKWIKEPSRMLIDGYNDKRDLVHPSQTLDAWLQWESNPRQALDLILSTAIEHTKDEYFSLKNDVNSIWYQEGEN